MDDYKKNSLREIFTALIDVLSSSATTLSEIANLPSATLEVKIECLSKVTQLNNKASDILQKIKKLESGE